ncbi:MAG: hypothetical protein ACRDSL_23110 [Pseudonocardiaceae bacterium]
MRRSDAKKWATASDAMAAAATSAQNLVIGRDQFGYAAESRGLVAAYTTLQQRIAHLLTGADREFDKISGALKASADTYEREDAAGAHRMNRLGGQKAKLEQQSTMDGQFANGNWPPAVADKMSDASVKDGDKSDWTPE